MLQPQGQKNTQEAATKSNVHLNYGLNKDLIFNLLTFYGPEFCGVVNDCNTDFMHQCQFKQLTQKEYQTLIPRIQNAEDMMEKFKLLYENIYANIYYTYGMCGQVLQNATLLDIEQALPVPQLLLYMSRWKTAEHAFSTIIYAIQQMKNVNEILGVDSMKYYEANQPFKKVKEKFSKKIQKRLQKYSYDVDEDVDLSLIDGDFSKSESVKNEYNIWNNHYCVQSNELVHGGLYLISRQDY